MLSLYSATYVSHRDLIHPGGFRSCKLWPVVMAVMISALETPHKTFKVLSTAHLYSKIIKPLAYTVSYFMLWTYQCIFCCVQI